ncbi:P-loop containing nucleoside triphosphate hydrolase protein, partial [Cladochytrium replicatum]
PHSYSVAKTVLSQLHTTGKDQGILLIGERGSGKSEAVRHILQYLHPVLSLGSLSVSPTGGSPGSLNELPLIQNAIMLLDSFCNFKTTHNENTSGAVRMIQIVYDKYGVNRGANITQIGLDRSHLITKKQLNARTFHVFYEMLQAAGSKEREQFLLPLGTSFAYLASGSAGDYADKIQFEITKALLSVFSFTKSEISSIFRILSAILWIGNLEFE